MAARPAKPEANGPRREKPQGKLARFADARKNNNDLLADCERLLLREAEEPQQQNGGLRLDTVIHPSEMASKDWCPRATYLRIKTARAGLSPPVQAHRFQTENIFEEGHEYHRKWQARFRRMGRLAGRWYCEACAHKWEAISPFDCPECGAPAGSISYHEVGLRDEEHLISGSADGEVVALASDADDVLIEIKSIGEGTVRVDLPAVLMRHTHEMADPKWADKTMKVLDHRGVWKEITKPFGSHLKQGLIYLRLRNDPSIKRIVFLYEYKPTSLVKAFYVTRDDEAVQELWDACADIVWALDKGGRPPRCISRDEPCDTCKIYQELEPEHDDGDPQARGEVEGEPRRRRRARQAEPGPAEEAQDRPARDPRGPDRPRGRRADGLAGSADEVGGLLGRAARRR